MATDRAVPGCLSERGPMSKIENELCESCAAAEWESDVPVAGLFISGEGGHVERCDECEIFSSDLEAAIALADEVQRRDPMACGILRHIVII